MACRCKQKPDSHILDDLVLVRYIGTEIGYYKGQNTKTIYGKRKPLQTFYVIKEDSNASDLELVSV